MRTAGWYHTQPSPTRQADECIGLTEGLYLPQAMDVSEMDS